LFLVRVFTNCAPRNKQRSSLRIRSYLSSAPTMRHTHLVITLSLFAVVSLWITRSPLFGVFDSLTHWGAVQLFLQGHDPYDFDALRALLSERMKNVPLSQRIGGHPWTLTFMLPFYAWPFPLAKFLLAFTNLSVYHLCIVRLGKMWNPLPRFTPLLMWLYIPFLVAMYFGQFSVFLALGTVLLLEWIQSENRPWWKWTAAMALLALKPQGFLVAAPLLGLEFLRTTSPTDRVRTIGVFALLAVISSPLLVFFPEWIASNHFSHDLRTATLSTYVREAAGFFGYDSPLWLWALPALASGALLARGVMITNAPTLLVVLLLSQLTAPYIWVYDACALMPLFYALIGAIATMKEPRWRWHLGGIFASVAIFPIYLSIDSDFSFMVMHNVSMGIATALVLPGVREYLKNYSSPVSCSNN